MAKRSRTRAPPQRQSHRIQAKKSTEPFRFLDLPTELRIMIYECYFEGNTLRKLHFYRTNNYYSQPALLGVNKEVYYEAALVFYQNTTFIISFGSSTLIRWLSKMPAEHSGAIGCIKTLRWVTSFDAAVRMVSALKRDTEDAGIRLTDGVFWIAVRDGLDAIWTNELGQRERVERYWKE